jgi:hypothetical protein
VDRCALFVDAGYVLADGTMAVHGTHRRDSVSWNYPGLLKLLAGLSRDRTGLPLLRCYWYEATVESRRTPEHDLLADLPGLKLRLGRMRPGYREGVETEIHRDLITLARNDAICDAVIVSAEEDLAQVIAEVQDLGVRVILLHITVDGAWTISRPLRQECDDIVEITGPHLRPFVDLIAGAEPGGLDDQRANGGYPARALANGHGPNIGALSHQGTPAAALPPGGTIYPSPVIAEYQRTAQPPDYSDAQESRGQQSPPRETSERRQGFGYGQLGDAWGQDQGDRVEPRSRRAAPAAMPEQDHADRGLAQSRDAESGGIQEQAQSAAAGLHEQARPRSDVAHGAAEADPGEVRGGVGGLPAPGPGGPAAPAAPGLGGPSGLQASAERQTGLPRRVAGLHGQHPLAARLPSPPEAGFPLPREQAPAGQFYRPPVQPDGPYTGPQPAASSAPVSQPVTISLADAVQAAHAEGFGFGDAVARDAPALWLEAVLARKPRMPSDLETRLLQGSTLPIDSLLHDEVRHALRRGFWDALERSRR